MSKCLICENIYPPSYAKCPICDNHLVREKFVPKQEKEEEKVENVTPFVEYTDLDDFGS